MQREGQIAELAGTQDDSPPANAIYCDNLTEGKWFQALNSQLADIPLVILKDREENHDPRVADLLVYDRPDIILVVDNQVRLVVEKTREVPTGHNVGQRMARLIRAVELGIPTIKFFPFDAMKHGEYAGRCFLNARILRAMANATEIHETPLLAVNWGCDEYFELLDDGSEDERMRDLMASYLESDYDPSCRGYALQVEEMLDEYKVRTKANPKYAVPPPSVTLVDTENLLDGLPFDLDANVGAKLRRNEETVAYSIGMSPEYCRREDPYTGTQFIYDYGWCRSGPSPHEKDRNLILRFPKLTKDVFVSANPNDSRRKSSNWYLTASALVFQDGILPLHLDVDG